MSSVRARRAAFVLLFGGIALAQGWDASADRGSTAGTASSCPIRLVPDSAGRPWKEAVEKAALRLAGLASPHDCRSVEVLIGPEGRATLAFVTTDGRGAVRALENPADLTPTLEALLVTLPAPRSPHKQGSSEQAPSQQAPSQQGPSQQGPSQQGPSQQAPSQQAPSQQGLSEQAPSQQAASKPIEGLAAPHDKASLSRTRSAATPKDVGDPSSSAFSAAASSEMHLLIGVSAGGRLAASEVVFGAPGFALQASVVVERWELGLAADYAPVHVSLGQPAPAGFWLWSFSTGLTLGRRDPVGPIALSYGVALAVQSLSEGAPELAGTKAPRSLEVAHPRIGAYAKVVYPARGRARLTTGIEGDAVLSHLPDKGAQDRQLPAMPRYGISLSFGLEVAIL